MRIVCPKCGNNKKFIIPLWVRATFRFNEDGTISILHIKQLESIEEKLVNQKVSQGLKCIDCGAEAEIDFNPYDSTEVESNQIKALEAL